jgi:predicted nucleotidyltransferase
MRNNLGLDLGQIPKELALIIEILNSDNKEITKEISSDINWGLFLELAMHHRVYPLLYTAIKNIDSSVVPSNIIKTLYQQYKINTLRMLQLTAEMELVDKAFKENEIKTIFLKGPILGTELYGDLSLRPSSDIDILIPMHDLEKVDEILLKDGYIQEDIFKTILGDWKWRNHHREYFHFEKGIKVEIHWRLNPGPGKEPQFNELWERKCVSRDSLYFLGDEDLFLFLVTHGARHGWSRLRWLIDIDRIVKKGINWAFLTKLMKKYDYLHIAYQALILSSQLLNTPIYNERDIFNTGKRPLRLAQEAIFYFNNIVNLHAPQVPKDVANYHKHHLFSLKSSKQKLLFVLSCLHPYPTDAETLPLPKKLHFLYFLLRPFLLVWRKSKKQAIS